MERILQEKNHIIYKIAISQNRAYVEDPNFRLRFLRANDHDAQKSANQMVAFLTRKEKYFGREKLTKDITHYDLSQEDMNLLRSGVYHIQDEVDRNGRMVVYLLNHSFSTKPKAESLIRLNYFVFFTILGHLESVQKKGIVVCYYDMSTTENPCFLPKLDAIMKFVDFATKVPIRRSAVHLCLKSIPGGLVSNNIMLSRLVHGLQTPTRARIGIHYGSDIELQYKLRVHGVFIERIPVDISGNIRNDILSVWFHKHVACATSAERSGLSAVDGDHGKLSNIVDRAERPVQPTPKDVLLGRGKSFQNHPGNVRFREIILTKYQEEYNNIQRYKRYHAPKEVTRLLLEDGVRFLQKTENGDGWVECDAAEAEKKVKQLFRSQKKNMAKKSIS